MRLVFAGTPDFAAHSLAALIAAGHDVVLVLTQPDRPSGRGLRVQPGPVKRLAIESGIAVSQPRGLRLDGRYGDDARAAHERLASLPHDAMIVAAYGLILPSAILTMPTHGCVNVHASLLPRWRGAAPIQRAIEAGDRETGITIMQMDAGLDTGDILLARVVPIDSADTAASLTTTLAALGGEAIVDAMGCLERGTLTRRPQHAPGDASEVTYAAKLTKSEMPLDFTGSTRALVDRIRAFDPWPGCTGDLVDDASNANIAFKVWASRALDLPAHSAPGAVLHAGDEGIAVATGDGSILLTELQRPGGKRLPARAFVALCGGRTTMRFVTPTAGSERIDSLA